MVKKDKCSILKVYKELMKRKSFRESTPRSREIRLNMVIAQRRRRGKC